MGVNKYRPHVYVLPEDDANREIALGFLLDEGLTSTAQQVQVLPNAGGWEKARDSISENHRAEMENNSGRHLVLLIDFDGDINRGAEILIFVPESLKSRVFVLGVLTEPERLKADLGSFEQVGEKLAKDCRENTRSTWDHNLLRHNVEELERIDRMAPLLRQILFPPG